MPILFIILAFSYFDENQLIVKYDFITNIDKKDCYISKEFNLKGVNKAPIPYYLSFCL